MWHTGIKGNIALLIRVTGRKNSSKALERMWVSGLILKE